MKGAVLPQHPKMPYLASASLYLDTVHRSPVSLGIATQVTPQCYQFMAKASWEGPSF